MTPLRRLIFATTLVIAGPGQAAEDQVTTFTLDNGMDVIVVEDHRAPVVLHQVWYKVGSADEPAGASGVAHFLEHLLFKATDTLESGEFSAIVSANGGRDNAFTSYDFTSYFQRVAADRLELMMRMESDRMRNIRLTEEDVRTEREVIIEERNQRTENSPRALLNEQMNAAQYLNHGYAVPIIGWMHEMEALDMDDVMSFYDRFYHPNNAILVVTGDVEPDAVRALAETYYGVIPAKADLKPRNRTQEPPYRAERRVILRDARVAQPYVFRSYAAPERDPGAQEVSAALVMLAEALGGGTTSFMAEKLQFESKEAVYAASFYSATSLDNTDFSVIVVPAPGIDLETAEAAMDRTLAEFMTEGLPEGALERIKRQMRASQIYARDDVESIGNRYGRGMASGLTIADIQAWPDILQAVTEEDVMAAAAMVFDRKASVTGWLAKETPEVTQ